MNKQIRIISAVIIITILLLLAVPKGFAQKNKPNILFITADDMNWNSVGAYGNDLPGLTPHLDAMADNGLRFENAYMQAPNSSPSRVALQTGRYPHTSGAMGFYFVDDYFESLPTVLKNNGYYTGVLNKVRDTDLSPDADTYWDYHSQLKGAEKRNAQTYAEGSKEFYNMVQETDKPFYFVVNIADPHKPFYDDPKSIKKGFNKYGPSSKFDIKDIEIPGVLPHHPEIRQEVLNYYHSVKRADDCVGAIMQALVESGLNKETVVMFISDHGMPFPFAKSTVYENGVKTPWIVQWPDVIKGPVVDTENLISSIDFMPTVLNIAEIEIPQGVQGQSFLPLLKGENQDRKGYVVAEFNENAGAIPRPSRGLHTGKYTYVFNAWATGKYKFVSSATWHKTYKVMRKMARSGDDEVRRRFNLWNYRALEELYNNEKDPNALNNLADDPNHQNVLDSLRNVMKQWMKETDDYLLPAFQARDDITELNRIMEKMDEKALERAENLKWKRWKNRAGGTGKNKELLHKQ